ncbi:hypothetical protein CYMTET_14699 [Cymbomonas tetramitiformis]|uniref:BOS complex subunit NCLN n=2 Tax=Cymbomonas tetramitiformis TaxID=36881 RepID=A0AAE0GFI4_9CHLO|nr:hypothetical protein CYMTET_38198 [Cymbomonas tetramitiformis]KAK3277285.1 hypothetical protein CYMTET_14699 [Cymbomonas tetramitiformis]
MLAAINVLASRWKFAQAALLVLFGLLFVVTESSSISDVYRMIQYDFDGEPYGSRRAALSQHASLLSAVNHLTRAVVVIPLSDLDVDAVSDLLDNKTPIAGMVFVLPLDFDGGGYNLEPLREVEQVLINQKINVPVYFAMENADLKQMVSDLKGMVAAGTPPSPTTGGYRLVVTSPEPAKLEPPTLENYQCWLPGTAVNPGSPEKVSLPTIAIVAYYDTLAAAPGMAVGADANGSGVAAILELARLFSRLYADARTRGSYNLLFVLTSAGSLNYAGAEHWLASMDARVLETIEFVLCLDSIGSWGKTGGLNLHISRPPKDTAIQQLYGEFKSVAEDLSVPFDVVHKKVNISSPHVAWEHEQFAKRRIVAATLSARSAPASPLGLSSLADRGSDSTNATSVATTVRLVGEALVRHMYGHSGRSIEAFAEGSSRAVSLEFLQQWLDVLGSTPRTVPYHLPVPPKSFRTSSATLSSARRLCASIRSLLASYATEVTAEPFRLDPGTGATQYTFYGETTAKLEVYKGPGAKATT